MATLPSSERNSRSAWPNGFPAQFLAQQDEPFDFPLQLHRHDDAQAHLGEHRPGIEPLADDQIGDEGRRLELHEG